ETARILCIATVTGFTPNDPHHHPSWFSHERGVEKWFDPNAKTLRATQDAHLRTIHHKALQELGCFLVPASRTWDRWISFSSMPGLSRSTCMRCSPRGVTRSI